MYNILVKYTYIHIYIHIYIYIEREYLDAFICFFKSLFIPKNV